MSKEGREVYLTGTLPKPQYVLLAEKQPVLLPKPPAQTSAPCVHMLKEDDKVPLFLVKLWRILHDTNYQNVVFWDEVSCFMVVDCLKLIYFCAVVLTVSMACNFVIGSTPEVNSGFRFFMISW